MQSRVWGERAAKAGIYIIFSLAVFAFLMFFHSAQQYRAAAATAPPLAPVPAAQPPAPPVGAAAAAPPRAAAAPVLDKNLKTLAMPQEEMLPAAEPHVYGKQVDAAALSEELARMAGMGFSFSSDVSANYVGNFYATAYCCEVYPHICGGNGVTASGTVPTPGLTVAADWNVLPAGTWLYISGVGIRRVEDSGSAILSARLDVAVDTHANALVWRGQGNHDVWILS